MGCKGQTSFLVPQASPLPVFTRQLFEKTELNCSVTRDKTTHAAINDGVLPKLFKVRSAPLVEIHLGRIECRYQRWILHKIKRQPLTQEAIFDCHKPFKKESLLNQRDSCRARFPQLSKEKK